MSEDAAEGTDEPTIRALDQQTVQRIAAGEVVERPASVVKELVENSLDADASRVSVAVERGGKDGIRVRDDGAGMTADELDLAVREHHTSKIGDIDDLEAGVGTLGFRGEALYAVGAVSRLTVRSRPRGGDLGHELTVEGGDIGEVRPAGCPEGTSVEVADLFYNVPARKKFLKTDATEFDHVNTVVTQYALANPDVAVSLEHDGREVFATEGNREGRSPSSSRTQSGDGDLRSTVLAVYGREVAEAMVEVEAEPDGPVQSIHGLVSHPETTRAGREYLSTFVNDRYVTASTLREAVLDAYGGQLASDRYPFSVLFVEVDPATVDVNVHPRKLEVRFDDESGVKRAVEEAVKGALLDHGLIRTSAPRGRSKADEAEVSPGSDEVVGGAGTTHEAASGVADRRRERQARRRNQSGSGGKSRTQTDADEDPQGPTDADGDSREPASVDGDTGKPADADDDTRGKADADGESRDRMDADGDTREPTEPDPSRRTPADTDESGVAPSESIDAWTGPDGDRDTETDATGRDVATTPTEADTADRDTGTDDWSVDLGGGRDTETDTHGTPRERPSPRSWQVDENGDEADDEPAPSFAVPTTQHTLGGDDADPGGDFDALPRMRVLGQLHDTYLVAETDQGLVLVDQHAADERVNYERLQREFSEGTDAQALASPVDLELTAREAELFASHADALAELGFDAERTDERTVTVRAVPAVFDATLDPELLRDVLTAFVRDEAEGGAGTVAEVVDDLLADLACYPSVTGNTSLTEGSVSDLLAALDACENPWACPHGRPVVIELSEAEIQDRFERDYPGHGGRRRED